MKVLVVCLMAAALVGMGASTPLKKVKGIVKSPIPISVEGEVAIISMDNEVLKEGPGVGDDCYDAGPADSDYDCASTCVNLGCPGYNYCTDSQECFCGTPGDYCPCP